jgi:site-specific DNA-methyltransferase (adenine-specific)
MLINDHFQNFKVYQIPKAQLIIADIPYNLGNNAYASNPSWYEGGDNKNGESVLAGKEFFDTVNLVFRKNFSAQVLKANMKVVGNCEYAILFYREKLPKFNNNGKMIFNCFDWVKDTDNEKLHPTQKPVKLLEKLIKIFTDEGDIIIDPCAGSGSTLIAAENTNRKSYGFEIKKDFYKKANAWVMKNKIIKQELKELGFAKSEINKINLSLFE